MPHLLDSRQLAYNADCVAFCPTDGNENYLAAGCYQLDEGTGSRGGRLYTYTLQDSGQKLLDAGSQDFPGIYIAVRRCIYKLTGCLKG